VKSTQRLQYNRLADTLTERGLVDRETMSHVMQQCSATGALLSELLVSESLVSDWELSRVCCEIYGLPYLSVEEYMPDKGAMEGMDPEFLRQYGLVPFDRFGGIVTVAMPGLVPSEVLDALIRVDGVRVMPVVGSVVSNRRWLNENLPAAQMRLGPKGALPLEASEGDGWAGVFDAGEEAVQMELQTRQRDQRRR
jgi:hypothetical protein